MVFFSNEFSFYFEVHTVKLTCGRCFLHTDKMKQHLLIFVDCNTCAKKGRRDPVQQFVMEFRSPSASSDEYKIPQKGHISI